MDLETLVADFQHPNIITSNHSIFTLQSPIICNLRFSRIRVGQPHSSHSPLSRIKKRPTLIPKLSAIMSFVTLTPPLALTLNKHVPCQSDIRQSVQSTIRTSKHKIAHKRLNKRQSYRNKNIETQNLRF